MNKFMKIYLALIAIAFVADNTAFGQSSLFVKSEEQMREQALRGGQGDEESAESGLINGVPRVLASRVSWTMIEEKKVKGIRVHDLVTILVREKSSHGSDSETQAEKKTDLSMVLSDWVKLTGGNLSPARQLNGDPKIGASFSRGIDGETEISREDYVTAEIQAEVVDVYPNGNVMLEASHYIRTDDETTMITLTGICRSNDVSASNSIMSNKIAKLKIDKQHTGIAKDYSDRGFLVKLVDFINPF